MIKIEIIKNGECTDSQKYRICKFKNLNWDYPIESHLNWLESHLASEDLHMLLLDQDKLCAYLNLVDTSITIDDKEYKTWGIGNVCVAPEFKGLGYGQLIMDVAKFYCKRDGRMGLLFCQNKNKDFYKKCGWKIFEGTIRGFDIKTQNINTFTSQCLLSSSIKIERVF